jgi:Tfp pilus assembly protein PilZ
VAHQIRSVLAVGAFREETTRRIQDAAASVGVGASFLSRWDGATGPSSDEDLLAIVLPMDGPRAEQTCANVRAQARLASVPLFGVTGQPEDLTFTELFTWGGDDLVGLGSAQPLARRLRPLVGRAPSGAHPRAGTARGAIVASTDARWRSVMGRALYSGGYSVRFVTDEVSLAAECAAQGVTVVVAADDLAREGPAALVSRARASGSEAAWIVVSPPKRMALTRAAVEALGRVAVVDGFAPPENVLFLVNELLASRGVDKRASARLLYGTTVAFRTAGREADEIGFSYNISEAGLYVRTLAPPDPGQQVWLEMWAPRSERRVRLAGSVAWARPFGDTSRATVPAGFGVKLTDGLAGDLERWRAGYAAFAATLLGAPAGAAPPAQA